MSRDLSTESTQGQARGAFHVPYSRADKLAAEARETAQVRALTQHPDVIALRVEKVRTQVDALVWAGIVLGLGFTMVNVQHFAAAGAAAWSLPWLAAWLLDPMVSLILVAVLRAEQVTARYQVPAAPWARRAKWFAFTSTFTMNTWQSWAALDVAGIVLHSVPPIGVLCAAEAAPWLRDRLTEAVHAAARETTATHPVEAFANATSPAIEPDPEPARERAKTHAQERAAGEAMDTPSTAEDDAANGGDGTAELVSANAGPSATGPAANSDTSSAGGGRKLLADYVAEARASLTPGTEVTPAWVRQVTDCARSTSAKVAAHLREEMAADTSTPSIEYTREAA